MDKNSANWCVGRSGHKRMNRKKTMQLNQQRGSRGRVQQCKCKYRVVFNIFDVYGDKVSIIEGTRLYKATGRLSRQAFEEMHAHEVKKRQAQKNSQLIDDCASRNRRSVKETRLQ